MNNILSRFGVTSDSISKVDTYKAGHQGDVLLHDGDSDCYYVCTQYRKMQTILNNFEIAIQEKMFLTGATTARVHLTPTGCAKNGRHLLNTVKPYQGNREGKQKPANLEELRNIAPDYFKDHPTIKVFSHYDIEADDALMIDHYHYQNGILVSADKDLQISPHKSYNMDEGKFETLLKGDRFGWIAKKEWLTPSLKPASKIVGKGTRFFLAQMIMGDVADNVKGLIKLNGKSCGGAAALALLKDVKEEVVAVNLVLDAYRAIDQNPIPEAEALWLLRNREDSAYKYLMEHELSKDNLHFLEDCYHERIWRREPDEDSLY
ncbi:5'-3' exonuclease [Acinetobacter phage APK86]|uniref:5'-3' exonuclease n=1 Tax=Acinetobacter phage APK86 TaxID=2873376 RepID=A0AAE8XKY7_9CAUD|nr:5'-3' exonuclease [Acinetobacter phage APK86]